MIEGVKGLEIDWRSKTLLMVHIETFRKLYYGTWARVWTILECRCFEEVGSVSRNLAS